MFVLYPFLWVVVVVSDLSSSMLSSLDLFVMTANWGMVVI